MQALGQAIGCGVLEDGYPIARLLGFSRVAQEQGGGVGKRRQHFGRAAGKGIRPPRGQAEHAEQVVAARQRHADERAYFGIRQGDVAFVLAHVLDFGWSAGRGDPAGDAKADWKVRADGRAGWHQCRHGDHFAAADETQCSLICADQAAGDAHDAVSYGRFGRCAQG